MFNKLFFALVPLILSSNISAAPCCSANAAAPSLISGDDKAQITLGSSFGKVIGDTTRDGTSIFRAENDNETSQSFRLDAASLISDRWQIGASIPLIRRGIVRPGIDANSTRLGDLRLSAGYEVLPEWSYSNWPKGYIFTQLILPTGRSIYDAESGGAVDATGQGFVMTALGALLLKRFGNWDSYFMPEIHYSFGRTFTTSESITVGGSLGGSAALGIGISPMNGNLRIGLRIQPTYGGSKKVLSSSGKSLTAYQLAWDTALELAYLIEEKISLSAAYTDQTLLGPANGTTLSRSVSLALQYRMPR